MNRGFYLDLAARGLRMPIGADLALHQEACLEEVLLDAGKPGRVVEKRRATTCV